MDLQRGVDRRRVLGWGGLAAAGVMTASAPVAVAGSNRDDQDIPHEAWPGGAYDRFVANLAARDEFSGVVVLSYRGRTVLSRSYGMADKEKGIRNHEDTAFDLSSACQPFVPVAVLQLVQQGRVTLSDPVGAYLSGFPADVAAQVTVHHLLTATGGLEAEEPDWSRVFHSKQEVHDYYEQWTRQARLVAPPGSSTQVHQAGGGAELTIAAHIVEAVSGMTLWDYVHKNVFARCGMRGSAYYSRAQWLTDGHIAHPYMRQADGSRADGVRHLDKGGTDPNVLGRNPARGFIGYAPGDGFATAPDLVRFAHALADGTLLSRPYAGLLTGALLPGPVATSYQAYCGPVQIVNGRQWVFGRGGGGAGGGANWDVYPDTGWVGVVLSNYDDIPLLDILQQQTQAITGEPAGPPQGG